MPSLNVLSAVFTIAVVTNSAFALPKSLDALVSGFGSLLPAKLNSWTKRQDNSSTPSTQPRSVWILQDVYEGKTFFE
jgi:hypothetical protein